jgi:hypothetical protein
VSLDSWTIPLGRTLRGIIQGDAIRQILIHRSSTYTLFRREVLTLLALISGWPK